MRKCFRDWSAAESEDKRRLIRNLLVSAAVSRVASDDMVKLFIKWIADYSEAHFAVIRVINQHDGGESDASAGGQSRLTAQGRVIM